MNAFDQDGDDLPAVVREFHRAKRQWMDVAWSSFLPDVLKASRSFWGYLNAVDALYEAVVAQGGLWDVGRFRYVVERHHRVMIEQRSSPSPIE